MSDFTIKDVVKALDVDRGRFADWISRKYIKASIPSGGQGRASLFTRYDIILAGLFKKLVEYGFDRDKSAEAVADLTIRGYNVDKISWASFGIISDKKEPKGYHLYSWYSYDPPDTGDLRGHPDKKEVTFTMDNLDIMLLVNFRKIRNEIDGRLAKL